MDSLSVCPGCGLVLPSSGQELDDRYNASAECRNVCGDLSLYTLSLGDKDFLHQLLVDTYGAQHSGKSVRPITVTFSLIGLYLTFECGYTGWEVQKAHTLLSKKNKNWPLFLFSKDNRSEITVLDVLKTTAGEQRNDMLKEWGKSVWDMWREQQKEVIGLANKYLDIV
jgi:hypothetical protein